jgi:hypothetical protein
MDPIPSPRNHTITKRTDGRFEGTENTVNKDLSPVMTCQLQNPHARFPQTDLGCITFENFEVQENRDRAGLLSAAANASTQTARSDSCLGVR